MNNKSATLIGYDLRVDPRGAQGFATELPPSKYYLGENIQYALSADERIWPRIEDGNILETLFAKDRKEFVGEKGRNGLGFYDKLKDISDIVLSDEILVLELITFSEYLDILGPQVCEDGSILNFSICGKQIEKHDTNSTFIGYDILNTYLISSILNTVYSDADKRTLKTYVPYLNQYGLFSDYKIAKEFCSVSNTNLPTESPFFVGSLAVKGKINPR